MCAHIVNKKEKKKYSHNWGTCGEQTKLIPDCCGCSESRFLFVFIYYFLRFWDKKLRQEVKWQILTEYCALLNLIFMYIGIHKKGKHIYIRKKGIYLLPISFVFVCSIDCWTGVQLNSARHFLALCFSWWKVSVSHHLHKLFFWGWPKNSQLGTVVECLSFAFFET